MLWPLVGRDAELAALHSALHDRRTHRIALGGAAGLGKSRLAREFADAAAAGGVPVIRILATRAASSIPLGPFAALAASGLSNRAEAERLVLSIRTVENTLQRVYNELGLTERSQLSEALGVGV